MSVLSVAHLNLELLKAEQSADADALSRLHTFSTVFIRARLLHAPARSPLFKRNILLAHARELLSSSRFFDDLDEITRKRAIESGLQSLRAAGESETDIDLALLDEASYGSFYKHIRAIIV